MSYPFFHQPTFHQEHFYHFADQRWCNLLVSWKQNSLHIELPIKFLSGLEIQMWNFDGKSDIWGNHSPQVHLPIPSDLAGKVCYGFHLLRKIIWWDPGRDLFLSWSLPALRLGPTISCPPSRAKIWASPPNPGLTRSPLLISLSTAGIHASLKSTNCSLALSRVHPRLQLSCQVVRCQLRRGAHGEGLKKIVEMVTTTKKCV